MVIWAAFWKEKVISLFTASLRSCEGIWRSKEKKNRKGKFGATAGKVSC